MIRRPTLTAALRHARTALELIATNKAGAECAQRMLRHTANPLPVDMAQLRKLANKFLVSVRNHPPGLLGDRELVEVTVEDFLKFVKDSYK